MQKTGNNKKLIQEIVEQHNIIRINPKSYIPILEKQMKLFKGSVMHKPGLDYGIETQEGKSAYQECINFLKNHKALNKVTYDENLSKASQDHANDIGPTGQCDHTGSDGSSASDRIERYIEWDVTCAENIDFGATTAEDVIISLIVDDGVPDRGHRENIFNPKITHIGVGLCSHAEYGSCTVLNYVGGISSVKSGNNKAKVNVNVKPSINTSNKKSVNDSNQIKSALTNLVSKNEPRYSCNDKNVYKQLENMHIKNNLFKDDPDAPEDAISVSTKVTTKTINGKKQRTSIKTYTLEDGSQEIVEIQEIEG